MRYSHEGGLTTERQQFREELLIKAAERFAQGEASSAIAKDLRVSVRSVQRWRQAWDEGRPRALRSQGPASLPRLSEKQSRSWRRNWPRGRPRTTGGTRGGR
ncbi:helix-turn-helix domain-containing protein [Streptomyces olivaceoviridis]